MSELDVFDYFAFVVMGVLFATVVIAIVVIGGLPGRIATLLQTSAGHRTLRLLAGSA